MSSIPFTWPNRWAFVVLDALVLLSVTGAIHRVLEQTLLQEPYAKAALADKLHEVGNQMGSPRLA